MPKLNIFSHFFLFLLEFLQHYRTLENFGNFRINSIDFHSWTFLRFFVLLCFTEERVVLNNMTVNKRWQIFVWPMNLNIILGNCIGYYWLQIKIFRLSYFVAWQPNFNSSWKNGGDIYLEKSQWYRPETTWRWGSFRQSCCWLLNMLRALITDGWSGGKYIWGNATLDRI